MDQTADRSQQKKETTQMAFRPYLAFAGNCREAFTRYQEIFEGELVLFTMADMPADAGPPPPGSNADAIMHAALTSGDELLMGADDPSGGFGGQVTGMCVNYSVADAAEAKRVFDALSEGGQTQMPLGQTFFSPAFGMCTDRFGTPWMVMADPVADS
jgi:PhnB protein